MSLDIWFSEDIRNALLAANEGSAQTAAVIARVGGYGSDGDLLAVSLRAYREGYKAALTTVALAFGISPQVVMAGPPEELAEPDTLTIPAGVSHSHLIYTQEQEKQA